MYDNFCIQNVYGRDLLVFPGREQSPEAPAWPAVRAAHLVNHQQYTTRHNMMLITTDTARLRWLNADPSRSARIGRIGRIKHLRIEVPFVLFFRFGLMLLLDGTLFVHGSLLAGAFLEGATYGISQKYYSICILLDLYIHVSTINRNSSFLSGVKCTFCPPFISPPEDHYDFIRWQGHWRNERRGTDSRWYVTTTN